MASGLKWMLASNSVVFMPLPRVETWAMESLLQVYLCHMMKGLFDQHSCLLNRFSPLSSPEQPWEHFIPVRSDFSDLLDKVEWCERHLDVCHAVSKRASEYIR